MLIWYKFSLQDLDSGNILSHLGIKYLSILCLRILESNELRQPGGITKAKKNCMAASRFTRPGCLLFIKIKSIKSIN